MSHTPHLTVIIGPTAAGKTAYAINLAQTTHGAVISADSRQVYVGMDIGTAKPEEAWDTDIHEIQTADMVEGIPHFLLNIAPPNTSFTLPHWQRAAYEAIDHAISEEYSPILAGGTMLYVDSIVFNYSIPDVQPNAELRNTLQQEDIEVLYAKLLSLDPQAKTYIEPHHKQRIIRALEVINATGKPFSDLRKQRPPRYTIEMIGIFPGWDEVTEKITERASHMLENGLLEETQKLREIYGKQLPLLKTMNYVQAGSVLDGDIDKKTALTEMVRANVRYARRQMSWWRRRREIRWVSGHDETK